MADKVYKTTSSKSSESGHYPRKQMASPAMPNTREVELMTNLAENINDSYRMVKQRQQRLYDLNNGQSLNLNDGSDSSSTGWQEVCASKNKLKRKKTLSSSLTSVTDSVNQEKRTRIEGIQLNCRGKLNIKENLNATTLKEIGQVTPIVQTAKTEKEKQEKQLSTKPPLPPQASKSANFENQPPKSTTTAVPPPPRLKRKLQENVQTIQKLNALTEQLRLELNELKSNLTTEKGAVRVLRAQNEAETRKWKTEVKKLQNCVEYLKKNGSNSKKKESESAPVNGDSQNIVPHQAAVGGLVNYEIQRLTNEINALKEANKALEEKKVINCDADRRKAADIRELKDSYEIRLTQIQKSAKNEISRLLEEIKTKERNIGQLKKDLQTIQNTKKTSRNATTNNNATNKTTTLNANKKPKNSYNNNNNNNISNKIKKDNNNIATTAICCCNCNGIVLQQQQYHIPKNDKGNSCKQEKSTKVDNNNKDVSSPNENESSMNEVSKLKNIELINNTRNVTTNIQRTTKILSTRDENNALANNPLYHTTQLKALEIPESRNDCINEIHKSAEQQNVSLLTTTHLANQISASSSSSSTPLPPSTFTVTVTSSTLSSSAAVAQDNSTAVASVSIPTVIDASSEMSSKTSTKSPAATTTTTTARTCDDTDHFEEQNLNQELAQHLNNTKAIQDAKQSDLHNNMHSDSDSALSSAPPSISPQPPSNGVEPTDIWQTIRSYTNDIEKLQKEVDSLQKDNEKLQQELNMAKEQIIEMENAALKNNNNDKYQQLLERIKYLEEQEHQLEAEANELREQNELLEFRILELEDTTDKWSLHSASNSTSDDVTSHSDKNLWSRNGNSGDQAKVVNPFDMLFRNNDHRNTTSQVQPDSGIISPQSQGPNDELLDVPHDELCRQLRGLLTGTHHHLEEDEKKCLQNVLHLLQQLDELAPRSAPDSLNVTQCCEDVDSNNIDMVKSRNSEYCASSLLPLSSSSRSHNDKSAVTKSSSSVPITGGRIVATVQPYNSTPSSTSSSQIVPHNTPTDSPRKSRAHTWQSNSLSESGVFVESDFLSDSGENNACTQTDFEEFPSLNSSAPNSYTSLVLNTKSRNVPAKYNTHLHHQAPSLNLVDQKRLQFYKDRLEVLESKIVIYESSGDVQAKRLAERLQREIILEKEVKELRERVEFLESENASLEEEKCEFEEAENDTRLRLQRLEVELEILSQRNVELEMSREALSAKYKDCHSECVILRDDIATSETHIRHLEEDKQKAKENFEFLHKILPVLLIYNTVCTLTQAQEARTSDINQTRETDIKNEMGNQLSPMYAGGRMPGGETDRQRLPVSPDTCQERELQYVKDEVKCLRHQIKELNSRHYAAMESADSHWVDLEREYKEREEQFRCKEVSLKQKIQKLQDCLREDARSAREKICQMEETEQGLKTCLVRVSKDHQKLVEENQCLVSEYEKFKEQHEQLNQSQKPMAECLEAEKKRNKGLIDELTFMRKLQQETENQSKMELDCIRGQLFDLKKEYLHIEVTNGELREEVATLEAQVETLHQAQRDFEEKVRCLTDEIRTKDEICQKLEKRLERSEGYSLADELGDTPSKRFKREEIKDLQSASKGLGNALRHMSECENMLPTQKQFQTVARDVKKLADTLLNNGDLSDEEVSNRSQIHAPKPQNQEQEISNPQNQTEYESPNTKDIQIEPYIQNVETIVIPPLVGLSPRELDVANFSQAAEDQNVVVGMVLFPQVFVDDGFLPSCSYEKKKAICEVPSELRKLSEPVNASQTVKITKCPSREQGKRRGKRCVKRRLTRGRINTLHTRVRRIISNINSSRQWQNVSDLDICESEVLQRNFSYTSFHSINDEVTEPSTKKSPRSKDSQQTQAISLIENTNLSSEVKNTQSHTSFHSLIDEILFGTPKCIDAVTECQLIGMIDHQTETMVEKIDCCVQVDDENCHSVKKLLDCPAHIMCFFSLLMTAVPKTSFNATKFNQKLSRHWELDVEFRKGIELLSGMVGFKAENYFNLETLNSYENFVQALSDLHSLQELFKPLTNPVERTEDSANSETHINRNNENLSALPSSLSAFPGSSNVLQLRQTDAANAPQFQVPLQTGGSCPPDENICPMIQQAFSTYPPNQQPGNANNLPISQINANYPQQVQIMQTDVNYPSIMSKKFVPQCPCTQCYHPPGGGVGTNKNLDSSCSTCSTSLSSGHFPIRLQVQVKTDSESISHLLPLRETDGAVNQTSAAYDVKYSTRKRARDDEKKAALDDKYTSEKKAKYTNDKYSSSNIVDDIKSHRKGPSLKRLEPYAQPHPPHHQCGIFIAPQSPINDSFFSCYSESDIERTTDPARMKKLRLKKSRKTERADRESEILQLLQEAMHLLKENRQESKGKTSAAVKRSKTDIPVLDNCAPKASSARDLSPSKQNVEAPNIPLCICRSKTSARDVSPSEQTLVSKPPLYICTSKTVMKVSSPQSHSLHSCSSKTSAKCLVPPKQNVVASTHLHEAAQEALTSLLDEFKCTMKSDVIKNLLKQPATTTTTTDHCSSQCGSQTEDSSKYKSNEDSSSSLTSNDDVCRCNELLPPVNHSFTHQQPFCCACPCIGYYMAIMASQGMLNLPPAMQPPAMAPHLSNEIVQPQKSCTAQEKENPCGSVQESVICLPMEECTCDEQLQKSTHETEIAHTEETLAVPPPETAEEGDTTMMTADSSRTAAPRTEESELKQSTIDLESKRDEEIVLAEPLKTYESHLVDPNYGDNYILESKHTYREFDDETDNNIHPENIPLTIEEKQENAIYQIERLGSALAENFVCEVDANLAENLYLEAPRLFSTHEENEIEEYCKEYADESELAKEKQSEKKGGSICGCCHCMDTDKKCKDVETKVQEVISEETDQELKYFIDSLILDLDAMEHARCICNVTNSICNKSLPKITETFCCRESFPVTITNVEDLGTTSLYVKWIIHDCCGIGGYEIFVDGYLTNRYYHSQHNAAVITDVDIAVAHKVALVATPSVKKDNSLQMICDSNQKSKFKCPPKDNSQRKSYNAPDSSCWIPSIFLYDPAESIKSSPRLSSLKYTS